MNNEGENVTMDNETKIDITFYPSENPGAHERHLIRRHENILFGLRATELTSDSLQQKQKIDHDILQKFMLDFRKVVSKAVALKPNEDSEVILAVKDQLDKLYATSVSIADDQAKVQESIKKLIQVVMQSVKKGADQDPQALQEIAQEESAREAHFTFLESKLVADILDPESPIDNEDLLPTLLCAEKDDLALATQLFDLEQISFILEQGKQLLDKLDAESKDINKAAENYVFMEGYSKYLEQK